MTIIIWIWIAGAWFVLADLTGKYSRNKNRIERLEKKLRELDPGWDPDA